MFPHFPVQNIEHKKVFNMFNNQLQIYEKKIN